MASAAHRVTCLQRAVSKWLQWATSMDSQHSRQYEVWRQHAAEATFTYWRQCNARCMAENMARKIVKQRWEEKQLRDAFLHWYLAPAPAKEVYRQAVKHWNKVWQQRTVLIWQQHAVDVSELAAIVMWSRASWAKTTCHDVLLTWSNYARNWTVTGRVLVNLSRHKERRQLLKALRALSDPVHLRVRNQMARAQHFFFSRNTTSLLNQWFTHCATTKYFADQMQAAATAWKRNTVLSIIRMWRRGIVVQVSWSGMLQNAEKQQRGTLLSPDDALEQYHAATAGSIDAFLM